MFCIERQKGASAYLRYILKMSPELSRRFCRYFTDRQCPERVKDTHQSGQREGFGLHFLFVYSCKALGTRNELPPQQECSDGEFLIRGSLVRTLCTCEHCCGNVHTHTHRAVDQRQSLQEFVDDL